MELYTEETVKFIAKAIYEHDFDPNKTPEELVDELKPIKLPSDEDIEKFAFERSVIIENSKLFEPLQVGAKWMREQIKKGKYGDND